MRRATQARASGRKYYIGYAVVGLGGARSRSGCCATRSSPPSDAAPTSPAASSIWAACPREGRRAAAGPAGASRRRGCRATPPSTAGSSTTARPSCRRTTCGSTSYLQLGIIGVVLIGAHLPRLRLAGVVLRRRPPALGSARRPPLLAADAAADARRRDPARAGLRRVQRPCCSGAGCFVVMFGFKIKQSPHVGVGPAEQTPRDRARRADQAGAVTRPGARRAALGGSSLGLGSARARLHARPSSARSSQRSRSSGSRAA